MVAYAAIFAVDSALITPKNDAGCGWTNVLPTRAANTHLTENIKTKWLIIGAGYTGLSAARNLAKLHPADDITILEANLAGEGASSRNSGYLVDSTLNDGHMSDNGLKTYQEKYQLNLLALERVKQFTEEHQVDCDWNPCGKFHATALEKNEEKLQRFSQTLSECGIGHQLVDKDELATRLGTSFYRLAVHTDGGVMLQPAKLARGMISALPEHVALYENSPVVAWNEITSGFEVKTLSGSVQCEQLMVCSNGFIPSLGLLRDRVFPLTLTASLSRPLTDSEFQAIGSPAEWGVLSAQAMGATIRLTQDRRIMIRNTAEAHIGINMTPPDLRKRIATHRRGLARRFPELQTLELEHTWSGVTCISGNSSNVFTQLEKNLFAAGCYNGGGIGLATLFGEELALLASGEVSEAIERIKKRPTPNWLPPQPFLTAGVKARLTKDRIFARLER